jgi:hypothetical protein
MDWIERELEAAVRARSWEDDGPQAELESYRNLRERWRTSPPAARAWRGAAHQAQEFPHQGARSRLLTTDD